MRREPFIVQTWSEEAGSLVPVETITFETIEQARSIARFAARRRSGVAIYRTTTAGGSRRLVVALGRVPEPQDA